MSNVTETATWETGVYQIETTDWVEGGATGTANVQAKQLANRTTYIKQRIDSAINTTREITMATTTEDMSANDTGKLIILVSAASSNVVYNLLDAGDLSAGTKIILSTRGIKSGYYCNVTPHGTNVIELLSTGQAGAGGAFFQLAKYETIELVSDGTSKWYITRIQRNDAGTVVPFATLPSADYLFCDGSAISRTVYARLWDKLGTTYGAGDGSTTFNIPDLRGEFIRGYDSGRGVDIDSFVLQASTTNGSANVTAADTTGLVAGMAISGTGIPVGATILSITNTTTFVLSANATATGVFTNLTVSLTRVLGSLQLDKFKIHSHKISRLSNVVNSGSPTTAAVTDWENVSGVQSTDNVQPVGGSETRPRNVAMTYCIKY